MHACGLIDKSITGKKEGGGKKVHLYSKNQHGGLFMVVVIQAHKAMPEVTSENFQRRDIKLDYPSHKN